LATGPFPYDGASRQPAQKNPGAKEPPIR